MPMTTAEWLGKVLADRPPLTAAQIAVLRPILAPAIPHMHAAPARKTEAAPAMNRTQELPGRSTSAPR